MMILQSNNDKKTNISKYRRLISPFEWLCIAFQKILPPFAVQIFIEGEGTLSIDELSYAVSKASVNCPGSRLVKKGYYWVDSCIEPVVKYINSEFQNELDYNKMNFLYDEFNIINGPTCEVIFMKQDKKTIVVFRASHSVMDGIGVITWIKEVFKVLRGESSNGVFSTLTDYEIIKKNGGKLIRNSKLAKPIYPSPFGKVTNSEGNYRWKRLTLKGHTNFVVAKLIQIISEYSEQSPLNIEVLVDLRRYVENTTSTANFSTSMFIEVNKGDSWEKILHNMLKMLRQNEELNYIPALNPKTLYYMPNWLLGIFTKNAFRSQLKQGKFFSSAILTNLMMMDLEEFSCNCFKAKTVYQVPPHSPSPLMIGIVEMPEHIEIVISYRKDPGTEEKLENFCELVKKKLSL